MKDNYNSLQKENELLINSSNNKLLSLTEFERKACELELKLALCEEKMVNNDKKILNEKLDIEKEKSLLVQKIEQYAGQIDDQRKRSQENLKDFQAHIK